MMLLMGNLWLVPLFQGVQSRTGKKQDAQFAQLWWLGWPWTTCPVPTTLPALVGKSTRVTRASNTRI